MRQSGVNFERSALHNLGRHHRGNADWYDLIIIAMHNQRRHVELLEVFGKVGLREGLDTMGDVGQAGHRLLRKETIAQAFRDVCPWPVEAVERHAEVSEELATVGFYSRTNLIDNFERQTVGIRFSLQQQRWDGSDQYHFGGSFGAVTADVTSYFATAGRMANVNRILEVQRFDEL